MKLLLQMGIVSVVCVCSLGRDQVVTYPRPEGLVGSDQYAVEINQTGRIYETFVYMTTARWRTNRSKTTSWTTFSFSGVATVKVTKLLGGFSTCKILPSHYGISPRTDGNSVIFELNRPCKISVEFDNDITHPLLVFADPLEKRPLSADDPNVVYFGPGVHEMGDAFKLRSNTTLYLAGGAYVKGRIDSRDIENVTIAGRGILSGENYGRQTAHLVQLRNARNLLIEGVTLINSPHFNLSLRGTNHIVRNVKMIGWYFSTDGVCTGYDALVEDCFFKVNDDAVKLYQSDMIVRNCVIWQMENGAPFQISWNMPSDNHGFRVSNIDIIRVEHQWNNPNEAVFDAIHGGRGHMSDYVFEDIRIENADWRLFYITIDRNDFADSSGDMGRISNLVFRNITVKEAMKRTSVIRGWDAEHRVSNILFENVKINGQYLRGPEDGPFEIDPNTTDNIRFIASGS